MTEEARCCRPHLVLRKSPSPASFHRGRRNGPPSAFCPVDGTGRRRTGGRPPSLTPWLRLRDDPDQGTHYALSCTIAFCLAEYNFELSSLLIPLRCILRFFVIGTVRLGIC